MKKTIWAMARNKKRMGRFVRLAVIRIWIASMLLAVFVTANYNLDASVNLFAYQTHDNRIASTYMADY